MSRQSKNAKNRARAKQVTAMHKNGEKGASKTTPLHGKKMGYRTNPANDKARSEFLKALNPEPKSNETSGKKILAGAGKAARSDEDN